jgi:PST family polysaccharide transporter
VTSKSRLKENILSLLVLQGANYLLPLIVVPYLVRVLGPANFGRVAFAQAFVQYFIVLTEYGFNLTATRTVVQIRHDPAMLGRFVASVMTVKVALMVVGFLAMCLLIGVMPDGHRDYGLYLVAYLGVLGNVIFPVWLFQGLERMRHITVLTIVSRVLVTAAVFLLVRGQGDLRIAAALQSMGFVLAGVFSLFALPRIVTMKVQLPSTGCTWEVAKDGWHVFVATMGGSLYSSSNVFVLGLMVSPVAVGYYAAAEKLIKAIQSAITPVSQAVYPHVAGLLVQSRERAIGFLRRLLRLQGIATLMVSCGLLVLANTIALVMFGSNYAQSGDLLRVMALIPFIVGINNVLGAQILVQFSLGRLLSMSIVVPAVAHICMLYFAAKYLGIFGVAALAVFTESFVMLIRAGGLARWHPAIFRGVVGG